MKKLSKLPFIFLFIASLIGLVLRWHYFQPIILFQYSFWLHAHSHVMFLGWIFNALSIAYVISFIPTPSQEKYKPILYLLNFLVLGMLIAFPIQGYGVYSISISTVHTLVVVIFCIQFFRDTKSDQLTIATWLARTSLIFFLISAIGPFVVGALAANGLGQSDEYHLAVYYYLHFQYNGVFTFGIFALLFHLLNERRIEFDLKKASKFRWLLFASCFPAYALSTLWASPLLIINGIGFFAAITQLMAFYYFLRSIQSIKAKLKGGISSSSYLLLKVSLLAFGIKLLLQLLSVYPSIALLAYEVRFYVIAYLHLVLIGMISSFLIAYFAEWNGFPINKLSVYLLLIGFVTSELLMISVGRWPGFFNVSQWIFISSVVMVIGITGVVYSVIVTHKRKPTSNLN
ncbi:MAG: hypothetical protein KDC47_05575 [Flavobacteriaceae bacterium]|jgi:hypothetical protein|nr:hypothetical protein [Flavobacteriaceae bacterium]